MGKSGGGNSTTTVEPNPVQVPSQIAPWLQAAMQNVIGAMPYAPLPLFAQPNPQQIPDLNPQQYNLINNIMGAAFDPAIYRPGNDAMNITRGALGMGPTPGIMPRGPAPQPFSPLPPQNQQFPVLPQWNAPPPQMGWIPGPNGPTWGVVNATPGFVAPPPTTPGTGPTGTPSAGPGGLPPGYGPGSPNLPPGYYIDPGTGQLTPVGQQPPPVQTGGV